MSLKEKYNKVFEYFKKQKPVAETELHYKNPFQLLVAVMLSAQCTDKRVNIITKKLFKKFPDAFSIAQSKPEEIYSYIKTCSYPNNKAKHLYEMSKMLIDKFDNVIPDNIQDLQKLPGVGRKTANVIVSVIYKKPAMAVDTHVFRVAARIGLSKNAKNPLDTEKQLVKNIPENILGIAHHWLILHGRYVCTAKKPDCNNCGINEFCDYYLKNL